MILIHVLRIVYYVLYSNGSFVLNRYITFLMDGLTAYLK